ncbi:hypothetical protein GN958_ATG04212 [Phytophthora infestans]|uniref:Uncharacterized protein n=1 Tax=Phytophthora infestans TaxID=4787 RepID=A0A8S9UZZ9_PHYIN|nr:hypothetical protein GN958_ATG04212 [Phytophthora infestans]
MLHQLIVHAVVVEHVYRHIRPVYLHILSVLGRQRRLTQVQYDGVHLQAEKHCQRPRLGHTQPRVQCHLQPNERHFLEQQDHLVNQLKLDLLQPLVQLDSRGLHVSHDVEHHPELHLLLVNLSSRYQHPQRTLFRINISLWFNLSCSW